MGGAVEIVACDPSSPGRAGDERRVVGGDRAKLRIHGTDPFDRGTPLGRLADSGGRRSERNGRECRGHSARSGRGRARRDVRGFRASAGRGGETAPPRSSRTLAARGWVCCACAQASRSPKRSASTRRPGSFRSHRSANGLATTRRDASRRFSSSAARHAWCGAALTLVRRADRPRMWARSGTSMVSAFGLTPRDSTLADPARTWGS